MTFNIDALTNAPVAGPLSTSIALCPPGEFTAIIDSFGDDGLKGWTRIIDTKNGQRLLLEVPCVILDEKVKADLGREKVTVRYTCWLDIGPDGVTLLTSEGKNVDLGRLREAVNQNAKPNWTFSDLPGAGPFTVMVEHRSDRNDDTRKFAEVKRVSRLP